MKKTFLLIVALCCTNAFALNIADVAGTYVINGIDVPYLAKVTLHENLFLDFEEKETGYKCRGLVSIQEDKVVSLMYCGEELSNQEILIRMGNNEKFDFTQIIDLSKLTQEELREGQFSAPIRSSLYNNMPFMFTFQRI